MTIQPPVPELAANKALEEIIALSKKCQQPDRFTHDRLERAIRSSIPFDAAISYSVLGALEATSGNEALMDEYHRNSIKLSNSPLMHRNYAASLCLFLRLREAAEQSRLEASLAPGDITAIRNAISNTAISGEITGTLGLIQTYRKLVPEDERSYVNVVNAASLQEKVGITDEEIMKLVQLATDFLRSKKIYRFTQTIDADFDDEGFISLCMNLNLSNEEVWNLNRQLFEIMVEQVPDQSPQLSVRFERNREV